MLYDIWIHGPIMSSRRSNVLNIKHATKNVYAVNEYSSPSWGEYGPSEVVLQTANYYGSAIERYPKSCSER